MTLKANGVVDQFDRFYPFIPFSYDWDVVSTPFTVQACPKNARIFVYTINSQIYVNDAGGAAGNFGLRIKCAGEDRILTKKWMTAGSTYTIPSTFFEFALGDLGQPLVGYAANAAAATGWAGFYCTALVEGLSPDDEVYIR